MELEQIIDYYFNKIKELNIDKEVCNDYWTSDRVYKQVHDLLRVIIIKGRNYLLTDSFIDYTGYDAEIIQHLVLLCGNEYDIVNALERYVDFMFEDIIDPENHLDMRYFLLLDKDLQKEVIDIVNLSSHYKNCPEFDKYGYYELNSIIRIVFAYYLYNNRKDNIHELCDIFLNDIDKTYESLFLNSIRSGFSDDLIKFVLYKVRSKEKKEIK